MRNLLATLDRFPPNKCRVFAKKNRGKKAMTHEDIAAVCGMSKRAILELSKKTTWENVTVNTMTKFSEACGVNLLRPSAAVKSFLRSSSYMVNAKPKQRVMFRRLMSLKPAQ